MQQEQNEMATRIQARYRGYRTRQQLSSRRSAATRTRAAVTIQRQVRYEPRHVTPRSPFGVKGPDNLLNSSPTRDFVTSEI